MEEDNSSEFDLAIDNFFEYFSNDSIAGESVLQQTWIGHSDQERENVARKETLLIMPKVMKNDIRRYYSHMFMNTVNSGDFNQLQSYFSTFMMEPAGFTVNYQAFNPQYRLPPRFAANGPKIMAHYFLGVFVMFPDTIICMNNTRIITSNVWSGTKIEINVDVSATKIYDISIEDWIPRPEVLEEKCCKLAYAAKDNITGDVLSSSNEGKSSDNVNSKRSHKIKRDPKNNREGNGGDECTGKRKRTARRATSHVVSGDSTVSAPVVPQLNGHNDLPYDCCSSISSRSSSSGNIPEEYVHVLCEQAALQPVPMEVRMNGVITLFLDESNHIEHVNVRMCQT